MVQAVNASVEFLVRRSTKHTLERALFRQPAGLQTCAHVRQFLSPIFY
jgi:hypothetical protein